MSEVKTLNINLSEAQHAEVKKYANENGISIEQAITNLTTGALRTGKLMSGIVTEFSPELQEVVKALHIQALKKYEEEKQAATPAPEVQPETTIPAVNENQVSFDATPELKEMIAEINKKRAIKGLAPLEKSLAEILYHWGENMADYSSFGDTTGLDFSWFKSKMAELALAERDANQAKSNVIVPSGLFSRHTIVDTPETA